MNALVSVASVAAASPVIAASIVSAEVDPISAAIEAHREAWKAFDVAVHKEDALSIEIPEDRRRHYHINHRGTDIGANDDPRWTAFQDEYWGTADRARAAALALLEIQPTTLAGAIALLDYSVEFEVEFEVWPDGLAGWADEGESEKDRQPWHVWLQNNVSLALQAMAAS